MSRTIPEILEKSHYQTFDLIEGDKRDSDSKQKFELSKLSTYNLNDKSCLDIGCNSGYFLFKLLDKSPRSLTGIELGEKFTTIANELNHEVYKSPIIKFILGNFFTYKFNKKFDFIICFSTYHYFGDNQKTFFDKCYNLMNNNSTMLFEMEEYPINETPVIDIDERSQDRRYPNNLQLQEYIKGKFVILNRYKSVNQRGSIHDRWFYELKRIDSPNTPSIDKRPLIGEYEKTIVVLTGISGIGKSTITELLLSDKFNYISIDATCITADIPEIKKYIEEFKTTGKNINYSVGKLFHYVREHCPEKFIDYFFNIVKEDKHSNIFIEGYVFIFTEMYQMFIARCKEENYRIWSIGRIL